jgi:endonuclease/exonuclease/phosphatase (EEP) superfamily protein YafD
VKRRAPILAALHLALVLTALIVFHFVGERSPRLAFFVFLPRVLFLVPSPFLIALCRRWWRLLPVATLVIIVWPLMGLHFGREREGQRFLRVLSWQVFYSAGDQAELARQVKEAAADVVIFEAASGRTERLLQDAGYPYWLREGQFAVASRWPVRIVNRGEWVSRAADRPWIRFGVQAPFGELQAIAVHPQSLRRTLQLRAGGWRRTLLLDESFDGEEDRLDRHLGQIDEELHGAGPLAFAAGDFNAGDGGAVLSGRFEGFTDAWASTNFGWGWTFPANSHKAPKWLRLDRIYTAPGLVPLRVERLGRYASDHQGLLVDLAVR